MLPTVRHTKYGRIRGMVVGEGGRSSGVLLYLTCTKGEIPMSISATHSPRKRTRRRTKNSTITIMDMIMIMVNRTRKKMTSWVIYI